MTFSIQDGARTRRPYQTLLLILSAVLLETVAVAQEDQTLDSPLPVWALEFSPDGQYLAAATGSTRMGGGGLVVWETSSDWKPHIVRFEGSSCLGVAFSPDGKTLALSTAGSDVGLFEVESGELAERFAADPTRVRSVEITPDGKMLVTAGADRSIKLWDLQTLELKRELTGHKEIVFDARVSPDGSRILSASRDKTARLWNLKTGELIETFQTSNLIVRRIGFSADDNFFFTSRYDARVRIYDSDTFELRAMFRSGSHSAQMSHNGRLIATSGWEDTAHVHRLNLHDPTDEEQKKINALIQRFADDDYEVRESASEAIIQMGFVAEPSLRKAMQSSSAEVSLRASRARREILSPEPDVELGGHAGNVEVVCFSPDDRLLVTGCRGGSIRVWEVGTWKLLRELHNPLYQPAE